MFDRPKPTVGCSANGGGGGGGGGVVVVLSTKEWSYINDAYCFSLLVCFCFVCCQ